MADAFFAWAQANEVPFFAVLLAIIGTLLACMFALAFIIDLTARALRKLKPMICSHDWRATKFQALVPGIGQECTKCGKQRRVY
ncbi:hypothetical protein [Phaeobacter sp. S60]|uniref:hypothetical protein n=1 Tax=Phaeobacter sp. S60 TaxID=1569353 RepID=UPI00058FBB81|nr:hypothetical protein [Phaeobacter sp. S60]KII16298.1 hypothetical protein OO25_07325 [Phaeobacter sp. S60]